RNRRHGASGVGEPNVNHDSCRPGIKKRPVAASRHGALRSMSPDLQLGRDAVERRAEVRSDQLKSGNGGNRDQSGDQAVFDRGGAIVVSKKLGHLGNHLRLSFADKRSALNKWGSNLTKGLSGAWSRDTAGMWLWRPH